MSMQHSKSKIYLQGCGVLQICGIEANSEVLVKRQPYSKASKKFAFTDVSITDFQH